MRMRLRALACLALLMTACGSSGPRADRSTTPALRVDSGRIVDREGATVILRGLAVNQLGDFYEAFPGVAPVLPLAERDFDQIAALGINSVRLVVSWSFLEPTPGAFDLDYVARIREVVHWCEERDIHVILDMHQDAWGKHIATGEEECPAPFSPNVGWDGAPEWATITDGRSTCRLLQRELSPAAYQAWQSFWEDREGIQQHLIDTWARLAAEFREEPAVIGYDILNEPNWGQDYRRVVDELQPAFRARCLDAIRRAEGRDHPKLVFFEPLATWSFYPEERVVPFTDDPNIVYGPHIYNTVNQVLGPGTASIELAFANGQREAQAYGAPLWIGEWHGGELDRALQIAAEEDRLQVGSARWLWKVSCGDPHFAVDCHPNCSTPPPLFHDHVRATDCSDPEQPEGVDAGYRESDVIVLGRPYPRAFPAPARYRTRPEERVLEMEGSSPGGIPLKVWIPGGDEPEIDAREIDGASLRPVPGGWIYEGIPLPGEWSLSLRGRGSFPG